MRLPSKLVIEDQKITSYLLVYQPKNDKSEYLALAGYNLENWEILKRDILNAVDGSKVTEITSTDWGTRLKVKSQWYGPNSRLVRVMTIWQQDEEADIVKFITLYPDKSQEG
ncbi:MULTISPECIES: DUF6883 domain-containing protein [Cyanophyceae]|uniref:DUF6883 domain-containing protein n=1 Tax=Cyanophyceae TaxID=3028117 RepID=UPI00168419CB|nr:DUF6883 domain-containing protein [Trichocoleus sp. FACHB-40]MBD2006187.1 hypothetical protein [Trichocoleus sp. FACHB-40]